MHTKRARTVWYVLRAAIAVGVVVAAVALCPSHDSFEVFLNSATQPSGLLGGFSALTERLHVALAVETRSWLVFRTGAHRGRRFVGAFGTWVGVPSLKFLTAPLGAVCGSRGEGAALELYAMLCVGGFLVARLAPAFTAAHGLCSLGRVRAGRLWVLLTSRLLHHQPISLINTLLQLYFLGPNVESMLGCRRSALLLLGAALAASATSLLWHGVLLGADSFDSAGGGSIALGVAAANAALYPHIPINMYGIQLTPGQLLLVYLAFDAIGGGVDLAAHVGGAIAGYWYCIAQGLGSPVYGQL